MTDQSLDQVFSMLADPQRRFICRYVATADVAVVSLEDLITAVAEAHPEPASSAPGDHRSRIESRLYHVHLPALDDAAILDYDGVQGSVTVDSAFPLAIDLLRTVDDRAAPPADVPKID